jgi:transcriptional regulator with XRE-family HTH domain
MGIVCLPRGGVRMGASAEEPRRNCAGCGKSLSRYNPGERCQACVSVGRKPDSGQSAVSSGNLVDGAKLAQLRYERGWTQEMLAEQAGLSAVIVRKLEQNARRSARISTMSALARALHVPVGILLGSTPADEYAAVVARTAHRVRVREPEQSRPTLLRALITERHWQRFQTFEAQFRYAAKELAEREHDPDLAKLTVSSRQWERWYAGNVKTEPHPDACRVLEHMFGYPIQQLLATRETGSESPDKNTESGREYQKGPAGPDEHPEDEDTLGLMEWIIGTTTTDDAIDQIERASVYLAEVHSQIPPQAVLSGVLQAHQQAQGYLQGGRQRVRQARELLRIDSDLLAHACLLLGDLGQDRKAAQYGAAALLFAQEAGSSEATAWSVQAKTARWQERYVESAELARRGFDVGALSPTKIELAYREANAIALFGDVSRAHQALQRAEKTADALSADRGSPSSVWSFPVARQAIFALSVAIHTGDPDAALRAAALAETGWANGEPKIPATWAQIQAGSSIAYLMKDSLEGAAQHIAPVLDLPQELRISTITGYLRKLENLLTKSRFTKSEAAAELTEQIRSFISAAPLGQDDAGDR